MKKYISLYLVLFFINIMFVGCSKESTYQPVEISNVSINISDVSPTSATILIKDTNSQSIYV